MGLLTRAIDNLITKAPNTIRPPASPAFFSMPGMGTAQPQMSGLQAMDGVGWLFSVVDRIATAGAGVDWQLFNFQRNERREIDTHDLLTLWDRPNPFYSGFEFRELTGQHFALVGEAWWVKLRVGGRVTELWPVRPDRMHVVPHPTEHIAGYVYKIGGEKIPLEIRDVIFVRRPSPWDPYRGIGPVGAILTDIHGDKAAAQWTLAFFKNGASPGGIVEVAEGMSDAEFEQMVTRWKQQHQGASNAHRVAFLEKAKWVDRKFTQREMQFEALRKLTRDIIFGAYGVHGAMMGVSENVNRSNAEAAEVQFARWVVKPALERIKSEVNQNLVPDFGDGLELDYIDPVPENQQLNLNKAERGFKAKLLTRNEGRKLLGFGGSDEGGDEFFEISPAARALPDKAVKALPPATKQDPLITTPQEQAEKDIADAWERRLQRELDGLLGTLEKLSKHVAKVGIEDIEAWDWDWWHKYSDEVIDELQIVFSLGFKEQFPQAGERVLQSLAGDFAERRAAQLLKVDGDLNLADATRRRVRELTARTVREGESLQTLARSLREDLAFSRSRADMVARTETAEALSEGGHQAAVQQGRDEKRWVTQGDDRVEADCLANEAAGWIPIDDLFPTGKFRTPQHVRCRCKTSWRTRALFVEESYNGHVKPLEEARCPTPGCGKLLGRNVARAELYCRDCKKTVVFGADLTGQGNHAINGSNSLIS